MSTAEVFERLNEAQREAVLYGEPRTPAGLQSGPLLIIAGAGTGKTATLAHRVANLLLAGVAAERVLLLTFSRRAAVEMTRRAQAVVADVLACGAQPSAMPGNLNLPWSGTFHAIGNRFIRQYANRLGLDASFNVLDRSDAADLMDLVRHRLGLSKKEQRFPRKDTCLAIYSHRVNTRGSLKQTLEMAYPWCLPWEDQLAGLCRAYVETKLEQQVLDYDDLLLYWQVMMQDGALAAEVGAQFDHVLVDEYQDTNCLQAEILHRLKPSGSGLTVVGDDAQSIYSFRAATVENILGFPGQFDPEAHVVTLRDNYRSTQPILGAANQLMSEASRQYRKDLVAVRGNGQRPRYVTVLDDQSQADYVVEHVLDCRERGCELRRQAVLFRNADHSATLELELTRRNIPYVKYGGLKFFETAHVKDLLSVLRWADNPRNRVAAFRILKLLPGMGPVNAERTCDAFEASGFSWEALAAHPVPSASREAWTGLVRLMSAISGSEASWEGQLARVRAWYEPRLENLYEHLQARHNDLDQLERLAMRYTTRESFVTELTLDPPQAVGDFAGDPLLDEDYLVLSTVHSAKGQEWESVYLLNVTDGSFPSEFSTARPELVEEERRLLYVAMTRAKSELHLLAPVRFYVTQQAPGGGRYVHGARSRFMSRQVLDAFDQVSWPTQAGAGGGDARRKGPPIDVASRLRGMW